MANITTTILTVPAIVAPPYLALCFIFLSLQALTLTVIAVHAEYRALSCFRIMFSIGVSNSIELLFHIYYGVAMLAVGSTLLGYALLIYATCVRAIYYALVFQYLLLATNRLVVVSQMRAAPGGVAGKYAASTPVGHSLVLTGLALCWIYTGFLVFASVCLPYSPILIPYRGTAISKALMQVATVLEYRNVATTVAALVFVIYLTVLALLIKRVGGDTVSNNL